MKDLSSDLRRSGRGGREYSRRIRAGYRQHLSDLWSWDGGAVHQRADREGAIRPVRKPRDKVNWRVGTQAGEVVAIEPNRDFEHVFEGDDPFMAAIEYAAKQIREG